jgi:prepilin-type N-terminal cleavage/methylation domain-containing protein
MSTRDLRPKNRPTHGGVTLVELLIVVAILATLIALLLPAVQSAREAARVTDCKSKLKQIAVGLHQYHGARGHFPAGMIIRKEGLCNGFATQDGLNWAIAILPYIEELELWRSYDDAQYNEAVSNSTVRLGRVKIYRCAAPDLEPTERVPALGPAAVDMLNLPYAVGTYRGVSGRSPGIAFLDSPSAIYPKQYRGVLHAVDFLTYIPERFGTIRDGSSMTLMVGESVTSTNLGMQTMWPYSYAYYSLSAITEQPRTLLGDYDACVEQGGTGGAAPCQRGWGSAHHGLINFAIADGSVKSFSTVADLRTLARMATIDGGETHQ